MSDLNVLIQSAEELPKVPLDSTSDYYNCLDKLKKFVDEKLSADANINELIGHNPLELMYDNHTHHGAFMATIFAIGNYALLAKTLPWVYRAYHNHGFSYEYFPLELKTWVNAVVKHLTDVQTDQILAIYQWMIEQHETVIELSSNSNIPELPVDPDWLEQKNSFLGAALEGDHQNCLKIANSIVKSADDIEKFYLQILQPVLYEVGILWEKAEISVAQEHLASAVVSRVMASVNLHVAPNRKNCGKVIIAASPNEYHEIGASMISDILENDGWKVAYLGANVPEDDLVQHLHDFKPDLLALSVTIPFNIGKARKIISRVKQNEDLKHTRVLVGGRVFNDNQELWQSVGADAFAANVSEAVKIARQWQTD